VNGMALPNLSNSMTMGRMRFVQSVRESGERRNPDTLARYFLPMRERWRYAWLGRKALAALRANPFYYYLVALYDFKLRGADDGFGRAGRTRIPFRLSAVREEVAAFHEELGLRLEHMELGSELSERLLPCLTQSTACVFREDGLVRLRVRMPPSSS